MADERSREELMIERASQAPWRRGAERVADERSREELMIQRASQAPISLRVIT
ncbi:hypothetical protein [Jatrophihabitans sp.]|uniref:hypothetical protein n=1 Tax=Jatrophihabitans sp. TaxID=1932789 RepID=UPI002F0E0203